MKWNYICRTTPNCSHLLQLLEDSIHQKLIPALSSRPPCSNVERDLLALPTKLGGMSLSNPTVTAESEFDSSQQVTAPLIGLITNQSMSFENAPTHANFIVSAVKKRKAEQQKCDADRIANELEPSSQTLIDCPISAPWTASNEKEIIQQEVDTPTTKSDNPTKRGQGYNLTHIKWLSHKTRNTSTSYSPPLELHKRAQSR